MSRANISGLEGVPEIEEKLFSCMSKTVPYHSAYSHKAMALFMSSKSMAQRWSGGRAMVEQRLFCNKQRWENND